MKKKANVARLKIYKKRTATLYFSQGGAYMYTSPISREGCVLSQGGAHIYREYRHPGALFHVNIRTRVRIFGGAHIHLTPARRSTSGEHSRK